MLKHYQFGSKFSELTSNSDKSGMIGELENKRSGTTIATKCHNFDDLVYNSEASAVIMLVSC